MILRSHLCGVGYSLTCLCEGRLEQKRHVLKRDGRILADYVKSQHNPPVGPLGCVSCVLCQFESLCGMTSRGIDVGWGVLTNVSLIWLAVKVFDGTAPAYLLAWSTTAKVFLCPFDDEGLMGPVRSACTTSKLLAGLAIVTIGKKLVTNTLVRRWHAPQDWT